MKIAVLLLLIAIIVGSLVVANPSTPPAAPAPTVQAARVPDPGNYPSDQAAAQLAKESDARIAANMAALQEQHAVAERARIAYLDSAQAMQQQQEAAADQAARDEAQRQRDAQLQQSVDDLKRH